jgi:hypothetical protein
MESLISAKQGGLTPEQRAKIFHRKMLEETWEVRLDI